MIGYVLLITIAVIMGAIVFQWMRTYVAEPLSECPNDVSLSIQEITCNNTGDLILDLKIRNNGKFDVAGYFIRATNSSSQKVATIDLSTYFEEQGSASSAGGLILYLSAQDNSFGIGEERTNKYNITNLGIITSVELLPVRFQIEDNRKKRLSCSNSILKEEFICSK